MVMPEGKMARKYGKLLNNIQFGVIGWPDFQFINIVLKINYNQAHALTYLINYGGNRVPSSTIN